MEAKDKVKNCPSCGKPLTKVGYTEHGTKYFEGGKWVDIEQGEERVYCCLECNYEFEYEELQEMGLV